MHDYLRAVGFSKVQHKRDLQRLLDMVMGSPDSEFASGCGGIDIGGSQRAERKSCKSCKNSRYYCFAKHFF